MKVGLASNVDWLQIDLHPVRFKPNCAFDDRHLSAAKNLDRNDISKREPMQIIRAALRREFSIERRINRPFVESNRWRNSTFATVADALQGGIGGSADMAALLSFTKMTPDQYRRLSVLQLQEIEDGDDIALFHELAPALLNCDPAIAAEIKADIDLIEIKRLWRSGHMAEGANTPGDHFSNVSSRDMFQR